jgi:hypothetical protein
MILGSLEEVGVERIYSRTKENDDGWHNEETLTACVRSRVPSFFMM